MKALSIVVFVAALGYVAWENFLKPAPPPPPPPPPPPAILSEPAPVISDAEVQKVLKSAQDVEPTVRWEAVVFLDKIKSPHAMPLMHEMLQRDSETSVRIKVVQLLGTRRSPEVLEMLVEAMKDREPEVRLASLLALEKVGDFSVANAIAGAPIRDQDEKVRLQAMKTLNSLQDKRLKEREAAQKLYDQQQAAAAKKK